jgi:dCTP deaminase
MNPGGPVGLLPDHEIRRLALEHGMIEPFVDHLVRDGVISYGLGSAGYDVRLGEEFLVFANTYPTLVDPKRMDERAFVRQNGPEVIVPPNSFVLAATLEYLRMPEDVLGIVLGKSTYARCGLVVNATPLEPSWEGAITLEISNTTPLPARLYAGEGIAQILFFRLAAHPEVTYADRRGVYQGQRGVTLPRVHAHTHTHGK